MSNLLNTLNVGASGLRVSSARLQVTNHNVTNVATPGFTRRSLSSVASDPVLRQGFAFGEGVEVGAMRRHADRLVMEPLIGAVGDDSRASTLAEELATVETWFSSELPNGPLTAVDRFFDALNALRTDPADPSLRRQVVAEGDRLGQSVRGTAGALETTMDDIYGELEAVVDDVQAKLDEVAKLNALFAAGGDSVGRGDYADRRDQLARELAEDIGTTAQWSPEGQITLMLGGHAVVSGGHARELSVRPAAAGTPEFILAADAGTLDVSGFMSGRAGGLADAYATADAALTDFNTWVDTFATNFNAQHQLGFDRAGLPGGDFFTFTPGTEASTFRVDALMLADPSLFATAGAATAAAGDAGNLIALADLEGQDLFSGGTRTAAEAMGDIYTSVGRQAAQAELDRAGNAVRLDDLNSLRESISGVDLDEEAANLLQWQAAYQAAARVVTATNDMVGVLMDMGR